MKKLLALLLVLSVHLSAANVHPNDGWVGVGSDGKNVYDISTGTAHAAATTTAGLALNLFVDVTATAITLNTTTWYAVNVSHRAGVSGVEHKIMFANEIPGGVLWSRDRSATSTPTARAFQSISATAYELDGITDGTYFKFKAATTAGDMNYWGLTRTAK